MPLVPLRDGSEFAEADQDVLAAGEKAYGQVLNAWAAIANSPGLAGTSADVANFATGGVALYSTEEIRTPRIATPTTVGPLWRPGEPRVTQQPASEASGRER